MPFVFPPVMVLMRVALPSLRLKPTVLSEAPLFLGGAFVILIVVVLISMALLEKSQGLRDRVSESLRNQVAAERVVVILRRMESGQRGFMLTGREQFLAIYDESLPTIQGALSDLGAAVADHPEEHALWREMEPLVANKLAEMAQSLRLFREGNRDAAIDMVRSQVGLRYMEDIRELVERIRAAESVRLQELSAVARRQEQWLIGVNIVAVTLIVLLAAISLMIVRRAGEATARAHAVLEAANTELEAAVSARTAELRTANEEIQKFAYVVSHDLRSPLVNIMGFTAELEALKREMLGRVAFLEQELAKRGGAPLQSGPGGQPNEMLAADFDEALGFIKASTVKMDRLINAVLTISREGNRALRPEEIDMGAMFESLGKSMAHQAQAAGAEIDIGPLPPIVSDRLAMEQIFSNLLDNALKYLRSDVRGHVRVRGRVKGRKVIVEIEDNGRGIEPRDRERVFELFRRAGPQDKPGEGMGLAHVRALVRRLGGVIHLTSTPGAGSTFTVTLPGDLSQVSKRPA